MPFNFYDKDKGWKTFLSEMKRAQGDDSVFAGYLRSSGVYKPKEKGKAKEPITVAQVAMINEFGSQDGHVPERSYMRSAMNENGKKLKAMIKKLAAKVAMGQMEKKMALQVVGEFLINLFRNKIQEGVPPANAPSTIKRKGSDHTLIDTGQMRDSLDYELRPGSKK